MRQLILSLGTLATVLIVTSFSVLCSVALTSTLCFFEQCEAPKIAIATAIAIPSFVAPLATWPLVGLVMQIDSLEKEMRMMATYDQRKRSVDGTAPPHECKPDHSPLSDQRLFLARSSSLRDRSAATASPRRCGGRSRPARGTPRHPAPVA